VNPGAIPARVSPCRRSHNRRAFLRLGCVPLTLAASGSPRATAGAAVKIGYYGPADPYHPLGGSIWEGVRLAIDEANAAGGYHGAPFRLVQGWDENPWTGGAAVVARLVYQQQVRAILGGIDAVSTHLAEQVIAKARLPLVDPASTDRSVNAAFVPWTFSVMPDDRALMRVLVTDLERRLRGRPFVLFEATDHDSRMTSEVFEAIAGPRRLRLARRFEFSSDSPHLPEVAQQLAELKPGTVVLLAGPAGSAAMLRWLRDIRPRLTVYGGPAMAYRTFLKQAGEAAGGVRFPLALSLAPGAARFRKRFAQACGVPPDSPAFHAYDAATLLVQAIREAGLDRTAIRDAIERLSPWQGVSGTIHWDAIRRNARPARLARIVNERVQVVSRSGRG